MYIYLFVYIFVFVFCCACTNFFFFWCLCCVVHVRVINVHVCPNVAESDLLTLRKRDKNFVCYTTEFGPTDHLL